MPWASWVSLLTLYRAPMVLTHSKDALVADKTITLENIKPYITQIENALNTGSSGLSGLSSASLHKRQSDDEVAQLISELIKVRFCPTIFVISLLMSTILRVSQPHLQVSTLALGGFQS